MRWFEIEAVWRLAVERQKAGKKPRPRAPRSRRPAGVERVTGAETRRITEWFAAGLSHAEVVMRSGKTHETIRYLYAQYITPSGGRLRMPGAPTSPATPELPAYFPEHAPPGATGRHPLVAPLPSLPSHALPGRTGREVLPPAHRPAPAASSAPRRQPTQVPDSWFTDPLSAPADEGTK